MRFTGSSISRRALAGLLLAAAAPAMPALAASRTLRGTVSYRERMALPPGAVVEVKLLDVSLADAPARSIAETRVYGRRIPARWILRFDSRQIEPGRSYALQARIFDGDRLLFTTTERHTVLGGGQDDTALWVQRVAGQSQPVAPASSPVGSWRLSSLGRSQVPVSIATTMEIAADGKVSGRGGCNGFSGSATIEGGAIRFSRMVSTMMACAPDVMSQERGFLEGLNKVRRWELHRGLGLVALLDGRGQPVMTLTRQ
ncbi:YbaY family lipoprotein [Bosea thiooxidans]|nr:YbaY family lipoprotein [Bosea sp. (in: a-proteobacteria)]